MQPIALALTLELTIPHHKWAFILIQQPNEIGDRQGKDDRLSKWWQIVSAGHSPWLLLHTLNTPAHKDYCPSISVYYWAKKLSIPFAQSLPWRRFIPANDVDLISATVHEVTPFQESLPISLLSHFPLQSEEALDPEHSYCSFISHTTGLTASVQTKMKETREAIENRKGPRVICYERSVPASVVYLVGASLSRIWKVGACSYMVLRCS